jgi:hypothetical protein
MELVRGMRSIGAVSLAHRLRGEVRLRELSVSEHIMLRRPELRRLERAVLRLVLVFRRMTTLHHRIDEKGAGRVGNAATQQQ